MTKPTCKDCAADGLPLTRKAPYPGPRCATHHRSRVKLNRETAHGRRLEKVYSIDAAEYQRILDVQGGFCAICRRASGVRKRLSVDHDHACCASSTSCGRCVRGLLCGTCNKTLGFYRDEPEAFERAAEYLRSWPSKR